MNCRAAGGLMECLWPSLLLGNYCPACPACRFLHGPHRLYVVVCVWVVVAGESSFLSRQKGFVMYAHCSSVAHAVTHACHSKPVISREMHSETTNTHTHTHTQQVNNNM